MVEMAGIEPASKNVPPSTNYDNYPILFFSSFLPRNWQNS